MDQDEIQKLMTVSDEEFAKIAEGCRHHIDSYLADGATTSYTPSILVMTIDPLVDGDKPGMEIYVIDSGFNSSEEKYDVLRRIGAKIYKERRMPLVWFLVSECWRSPAATPDGNSQYRRPADDPNREEAIMYHGTDFSGKQWEHGFRTVVRDEKEVMSFSGDWKTMSHLDAGDVHVSSNLSDELRMGFMAALVGRV